MAASFLDDISLGTLVAPVTDREFRDRYFDRMPLVVQRRSPDFYGDLFTLQEFDHAVACAPRYVKAAEASEGAAKRNDPLKPAEIEAILTDMRQGRTLILDHHDRHSQSLGLLCRSLSAQLGHPFQTNLYLTPPNGKGFAAHWDNHDVFILQVVGNKHWKLERTRRALPGLDEVIPADERQLRGELFEFTLEQGDLIYIPRGFVHAAECGVEPSLHITLGMIATTVKDLLQAAIAALALRNEDLAVPLPLGFLKGNGEALTRLAAASLRRAAEEGALAGAVEQFRDELVARFPIDTSGQLAGFFRPVPLALADVVRPRPGCVYRMHVGEESVRINVGTRSVTFPGLFREALEFALARPSYRVAEVPGELHDEERVAFVERLIEEGLVVRQPVLP